jgi:broad specificity phosphatase PhoE
VAAPEDSLPRFRGAPLGTGEPELADPGPDARVLHFLRHGEALHQRRNEEARERGAHCRCFEEDPAARPPGYRCPYWAEDLVDSPLTPRGREQVRDRGGHLTLELVLSSPMARTLESAVLAFPPEVPILALPELRPRVGRHMHSKRSPRATLARRFPRADLSRVHEEADRAWAPETEPRARLEARAAAFLERVFAGEARQVAVVTHFTLLLALLLEGDDGYTLGPGSRPSGAPPILDCRGCPEAEELRRPMGVGEIRSLVVHRA